MASEVERDRDRGERAVQITGQEILARVCPEPCHCGWQLTADTDELFEAERMNLLWRIPTLKRCRHCGASKYVGDRLATQPDRPDRRDRRCGECGGPLSRRRRRFCADCRPRNTPQPAIDPNAPRVGPLFSVPSVSRTV